MAALITELELGPVHVVGHSYGGYVSLAFTMQHPDLALSVVLAEPPVKPLLSRSLVGQAISDSFDQRVLDPARMAYIQHGNAQGIQRFLNGVIYPGWFEQLPLERQTEIIDKSGPEHRLELLTERSIYMPSLACEQLGELELPILLMMGENSHAMFKIITRELETCLDGESFIMVPEVGHDIFSNAPFTYDAIRSFLNVQ